MYLFIVTLIQILSFKQNIEIFLWKNLNLSKSLKFRLKLQFFTEKNGKE